MPEKIRMDYSDMADMSKTFQQGAEQLNKTRTEMQNVAKQLSEGALLGRGGTAFTEAINSRLCTSIEKLSRKFTELDGDVKKAVQEMKQADQESKSKF